MVDTHPARQTSGDRRRRSEEREVAFVACSRAREVLVLAVDKKTHDALKAKRRGFYDHFEVHEVSVGPTLTATAKQKAR